MRSPPGSEATLNAGNEEGREKLIADDKKKVTDLDSEINSIYLERQAVMNREYVEACKANGIKPDAGYRVEEQQFAGNGISVLSGIEEQGGEPKSVPLAAPFQDVPLAEPFQETSGVRIFSDQEIRALSLALTEAPFFCGKDLGRLAVIMFVLGLDNRSLVKISRDTAFPLRSLQRKAAEGRSWLLDLGSKLQSVEASP